MGHPQAVIGPLRIDVRSRLGIGNLEEGSELVETLEELHEILHEGWEPWIGGGMIHLRMNRRSCRRSL